MPQNARPYDAMRYDNDGCLYIRVCSGPWDCDLWWDSKNGAHLISEVWLYPTLESQQKQALTICGWDLLTCGISWSFTLGMFAACKPQTQHAHACYHMLASITCWPLRQARPGPRHPYSGPALITD